MAAIYSLGGASNNSSISLDNQSSYVGNARDVEIHHNYTAVPENDELKIERGFLKLLPDGIREKTFRYAESILGAPIEEFENTRVYEKAGYRIKLFGGSDKSYNSIEYGPLSKESYKNQCGFSKYLNRSICKRISILSSIGLELWRKWKMHELF